MGVHKRFTGLLDELRLKDAEVESGTRNREHVCKALNEQYWNSSSSTDNSIYVGSWLKRTRIRPPRDVDVLFMLPPSVHQRFEQRTGNRQSQLLQEVKAVLLKRFSRSDIKGDGPVVAVNFGSYQVELIPGFKLNNGRYWIPFTKNGGFYKEADYDEEGENIRRSNDNGGNTRDLIRMIKCWQGECNVPIRSFWLELLAVDFLNQWQYRGKSAEYYDWMVRDFLVFMISRANMHVFAPGTFEAMNIGDGWKSRAESARDRAIRAIDLEQKTMPASALVEWRKIFGLYIS